MKRIIILIEEQNLTEIDLQPLLRVAHDLRVETVPDENKVKFHRTVKPNASIQSVVMKHYTPEGMFTVERASKWLEDEGFNSSSGPSAVSLLIKAGFLQRIGRGKVKFARPPENGNA